MKWLAVCLLILIGALICPLAVAFASATDTITVTATGTGTDPITDFVVIIGSQDEESGQWTETNGSWTIPESAEYVVIVRRFDRYAESIDDGDLVYQGDAEAFNETITGIVEGVYYTAWTYNGELWSAPVYYHLEVESSMINAILLIGMIVLGIALSGSGYYFKKVPIIVIASLIWFGTGAWSYTLIESSYDIYFFVGCAGVLMGLFSVLEPFIWVVAEKKVALSPMEKEQELDSQYQKEFDEASSRIRRKRRPF